MDKRNSEDRVNSTIPYHNTPWIDDDSDYETITRLSRLSNSFRNRTLVCHDIILEFHPLRYLPLKFHTLRYDIRTVRRTPVKCETYWQTINSSCKSRMYNGNGKFCEGICMGYQC